MSIPVELTYLVVGGSGEGGWQVGLYSSILHLQQLAQWLNPKVRGGVVFSFAGADEPMHPPQ
jgi:hypothetical protein